MAYPTGVEKVVDGEHMGGLKGGLIKQLVVGRGAPLRCRTTASGSYAGRGRNLEWDKILETLTTLQSCRASTPTLRGSSLPALPLSFDHKTCFPFSCRLNVFSMKAAFALFLFVVGPTFFS